MATRIKLRRDTLANWTTAATILSDGEAGYETDTHVLRIGDGTTPFLSLVPVAAGAASIIAKVTIDDEDARFHLTTADVQNGDYVLQTNTYVLYEVTDQTALDGAGGYTALATVTWGQVTGKPTFGTAATAASSDFATAEQGSHGQSAYEYLTDRDLGNGWYAAGYLLDDTLELASTALQPTDDGSGLTNIPSPFDQSVNTTDSPTVAALTIGTQTIACGTGLYGYDAFILCSTGSNPTYIDGGGNITTGVYYGDGSSLSGILLPTGDGSGLTFATPPLTASSTGSVGQIANDGTSLYLCTGTDTWVKADIATLGFATF